MSVEDKMKAAANIAAINGDFTCAKLGLHLGELDLRV